MLTDKPIERMLSNPYRSRRIAKWAIELEEHDIEYQDDVFADGQTPTNVFSEPGLVSASPKKEFFRAKRESRLISSSSKGSERSRTRFQQKAFD